MISFWFAIDVATADPTATTVAIPAPTSMPGRPPTAPRAAPPKILPKNPPLPPLTLLAAALMAPEVFLADFSALEPMAVIPPEACLPALSTPLPALVAETTTPSNAALAAPSFPVASAPRIVANPETAVLASPTFVATVAITPTSLAIPVLARRAATGIAPRDMRAVWIGPGRPAKASMRLPIPVARGTMTDLTIVITISMNSLNTGITALMPGPRASVRSAIVSNNWLRPGAMYSTTVPMMLKVLPRASPRRAKPGSSFCMAPWTPENRS